jgi:hypothetical protein
LEQRAVPQPRSRPGTFDLQQRLHLLPEGRVHDGRVLARVYLLPITDLTAVGNVGQELMQAVPREGLAPAQRSLARPPALVPPTPPLELLDHGHQTFVLQVKRKDGAYALGFGRVDEQLRATRLLTPSRIRQK